MRGEISLKTALEEQLLVKMKIMYIRNSNKVSSILSDNRGFIRYNLQYRFLFSSIGLETKTRINPLTPRRTQVSPFTEISILL